MAKFGVGDFAQTEIFFGCSKFPPAGFGLLKLGSGDCVQSVTFLLYDPFLTMVGFDIAPLDPGDGVPLIGGIVRNCLPAPLGFIAVMLGLGDGVPTAATFGVQDLLCFGVATLGCAGDVIITTSGDSVTPSSFLISCSDCEVVPTTTTSDDSELAPVGFGVVLSGDATGESAFGTLGRDDDVTVVFDNPVVMKLLISFGEAFLMSSLSLTTSLHL